MRWTNYHSHCYYCDGSAQPAAYVTEAIRQGFRAYGFSSHAPVPFATTWSMKQENLAAYLAEINRLKEQHQAQIQLYTGLEVDFMPGVVGPRSAARQLPLDYTVGSVHFVEAFPDGQPWEIDGAAAIFRDGLNQIFHGDIRAAVTRYYELTRRMVTEQCPTIIGHLDKIKMQNTAADLFSEEADWYQQEILATLAVIATSPAVVEVNTRGLYKNRTADVYPSRWVLAQMQQRNIPVTISSDAHQPAEIAGYFEHAARVLAEVGYQNINVLIDGRWQETPLG